MVSVYRFDSGFCFIEFYRSSDFCEEFGYTTERFDKCDLEQYKTDNTLVREHIDSILAQMN